MKRSTFIKNAAAVSAAIILKPGLVFGTRANTAIRVGIIGCGNRGTAVISSMSKFTNINIIAMADLFEDKLKAIAPKLNELNAAKGFPAIAAANTFQGSKAYLKLLSLKDVDAVLISSPAYTHPPFLEAAIQAGKHVYCEKPVATDAQGCKRIREAGEKVNGKLSVVIGFQIRYASPYVEMVKRMQQADIGDLVNAQLYYFSSATRVNNLQNVSNDEMRIRNHYHFHALSGGILLDQGIHMLDVCNWTLQGHPLKAVGTGGKKGSAGLGDSWNNYQVLYDYPGDVKVSFHSTQLGPSFGDVCCRFLGTKGIAEAHYSGGVFINGDKAWDSGVAKAGSALTPQQQAAGVFLSSLQDADANKEKAFIQSIETGKYLNETASGADSTLTAILGREAARLGRETHWDKLLTEGEMLDPKLNLSQFDK
ncbi:MAG: Gfo/Idh/MocA family oxidoreductase [Ferruginibacter sp.]|nr:Gfo/Idh/MocA family oxidoreductase [Ferruginibacter sp.]